MTDGGTAFQPGQTEPSLPFRSRGAYAGHEAFGAPAGAVLLDPEVMRDLRSAAEFATAERRIAGGLLYGRAWMDDDGPYLVVDGYLEAGPGENAGDRIIRDGEDNFTLTDADLRLLRSDAARMYSAALEVGWWRTLPAPGGFSPRDYLTQQDLIEPGGLGLVVFGSSQDWGAVYLGPDGRPPGPADGLVPALRQASEGDASAEPGPEPVDIAAGESLLTPHDEPDDDLDTGTVTGTVVATRQPTLTSAPQPAGPPAISPVRVPSAEWGAKPVNPGNVGMRMPTDVKIVIGALILVSCAVAAIIGVLLSSAMIAVIIAVVGFLAITTFVAVTRL
jgi:hypothetical protein